MENELEPVAYINVEQRSLEWAKPTQWETPTVVKMDKVPLYVKKEWQGLTDEEIAEIRLKSFDSVATNRAVVKAIEAKLKEKNFG